MAFLGHDVLMAGDAHAWPAAAVEAAHANHEHAIMPEGQPGAGQHTASTSTPDHEHDPGFDACATMRHLVQRPVTPLPLDAQLGAIAASVRMEPSLPGIDHWWCEPTAPPDVVRALIQVFRI